MLSTRLLAHAARNARPYDNQQYHPNKDEACTATFRVASASFASFATVDYALLVRIRSAAPHALAVAAVRLALLLVEGGAVQAGRGGGAILSVGNWQQHANGGGRDGEHEGRGAHLVGLLVCQRQQTQGRWGCEDAHCCAGGRILANRERRTNAMPYGAPRPSRSRASRKSRPARRAPACGQVGELADTFNLVQEMKTGAEKDTTAAL